jgi:hypothetical protein
VGHLPWVSPSSASAARPPFDTAQLKCEASHGPSRADEKASCDEEKRHLRVTIQKLAPIEPPETLLSYVGSAASNQTANQITPFEEKDLG